MLLCYNDGDLLEDSISYLLGQDHDLVVWDHGSTDNTPDVILQFRRHLVETRLIPREFDFYEIYPEMSRNLLENYVRKYSWISWPDQDEFLEGANRSQPYGKWLRELCESPYDWVQFNNYNYWYTSADDLTIQRAPERIRHYCLFPGCAPRIRCWRASATNIRVFNHNPPLGEPSPLHYNLRHYPMRSAEQAKNRVLRDRAGLRRGRMNYHYENMMRLGGALEIRPEQLHVDDLRSELNPTPIFDWWSIYGAPPAV